MKWYNVYEDELTDGEAKAVLAMGCSVYTNLPIDEGAVITPELQPNLTRIYHIGGLCQAADTMSIDLALNIAAIIV